MKKSILLTFFCIVILCLSACGLSKGKDKKQEESKDAEKYFKCLEDTFKADSYILNLKEEGRYDSYDGLYYVYKKDGSSYLGYSETMEEDSDKYFEYYYIDKAFFENKSSRWSDDVEVKYYTEDDFDSKYSSEYIRYRNFVALEGKETAEIMDTLIASQDSIEVPSYSVYKEAIIQIAKNYSSDKSEFDFVKSMNATDSKFNISMNAAGFYNWCEENIDEYEMSSLMKSNLEDKDGKKVRVNVAITIEDGFATGFKYIHKYSDSDDTSTLKYTFTEINKLDTESEIVSACTDVVDAIKPGDYKSAMVELINWFEDNRYSYEEYKFKIVESNSSKGYDELHVYYKSDEYNEKVYTYTYNGFEYECVDETYTNSSSGYYKLDDMLAYLEDGVDLPTSIDLTMKVWVQAEDLENGWIVNRCEEFNRLHPEWNITFKYEICSAGDALSYLSYDSTSPTVYSFANDQLTSLIENGLIAPITGKYVEEIKNNNSENMLKTVVVGNDIFGAPYTGNTWFMYYNKSIYTEEDIKSLDAMMAKSPVAFPLNNSWYAYAFYEGNGCHLNGGVNDPSLGIDIGGQKAIDVTKYIMDMYNSGKLIADKDGCGMTGLENGSIGAIFTGSWDYEQIYRILGDNMGIAALPTYNLNGKEVQMYSFMGSHAFGVNPNNDIYKECPEAAEALATFLSNSESQLSRYEMRSTLVPSSKELAENILSEDALVQAMYKTLESTSVLQPYNNEFNNNYWQNMVIFMNAIIDGIINDSNMALNVEAFNNALNGR